YFIVHLGEYWKNRNHWYLLFWIGVGGTVIDQVNLLSYMYTLSTAGDRLYIYDGIDPISPNCDQLACMVFVLTVRLSHAKEKVGKEKNRLRRGLGYKGDAPDNPRKHAEHLPLAARWIWWCLIPFPIAAVRLGVSIVLICVAIDRHGHDLSSSAFWTSLLAARLFSGVGLFLVLHGMFGTIFEQVVAIEGNLDIMKDVLAKLPRAFADEKRPLLQDERPNILREKDSRQVAGRTADRRDTVVRNISSLTPEASPLPVLEDGVEEEETFQDWLNHWHYARVDFLDEQFGSDAVLGICVVTMFFCALQLLASWLCYDPNQHNFTYQGLHSAMAFALTLTFGGIFMYLSNVCIKVNDLFLKMLTQLDELSAQSWREHGYKAGHVRMIHDFKIVIEAEGSPHTFLGYTMTWRLVCTILTPLFAPTLATIRPLLQVAQHNVHDAVWNSEELNQTSQDAHYWLGYLANESHLNGLLSI
ncbi:unnamed protein product, partial [Symbiodinium microadriaticum]